MKHWCYLLLITGTSFGQPLPSLKIDHGAVFQLTGKSFSLDTLIMGDSSILLLDGRYSTTLLRANFVSVGNGCVMSGHGKDGENGAPGADGSSSLYAAGKDGHTGFSGVNLFFNFSDILFKDSLQVLLIGGRGGDGGPGGAVTSSLSGISAPGRDGRAQVGSPGHGGDGGDGGNITVSFPAEYKEIVQGLFKINNMGGPGGNPATFTVPINYRSLDSNPPPRAGKQGAAGKIKYVTLRR